ncbi:MAG: hypothetical protein LUC95_03275, partial [Lachnospiraceae bacterium]|nr:hypothetical protein [Lachnospiraceae bacterium]
MMEKNKSGRMVVVDHALNAKSFFFIFWLYLFTFQSPLEEVFVAFKLIDEVYSLLFIPLILFTFIDGKSYHFKKDTAVCVFSLSVFLVAGLTGNILFQYQPWGLVFQDVFTNIKYFMAIG